MNILQLIDEPWDSGITNYALTLSKAMTDRGHKVIVGALPGKPPLLQAMKMGLPALPLNFVDVNIFHLRLTVKRENIELINVHGGRSHFWAYFSLRSTLSRLPLVRTRADVRPPNSNIGNKYLYEGCNLVICAADFIRRSCVENLKIPDYKFVTVYQGVDTQKFRPQSGESVRREFKINNDTMLVGMVGRLDPVKGHAHFIRAAKMVKDVFPPVKFLIVGKEEKIKWNVLSGQVAELGLANEVIYAGGREDIVEVMNACDVGVIASVNSEAVSRVGLEWMACGKPVVSTTVGCLPELIQDRKTGFLIEPHDYEAMAQQIYSLLGNKALCQRMGEKAQQHIAMNFNMEHFALSTEHAYHKVLELN